MSDRFPSGVLFKTSMCIQGGEANVISQFLELATAFVEYSQEFLLVSYLQSDLEFLVLADTIHSSSK